MHHNAPNYKVNKTVPLGERKGHTTRCIASKRWEGRYFPTMVGTPHQGRYPPIPEGRYPHPDSRYPLIQTSEGRYPPTQKVGTLPPEM